MFVSIAVAAGNSCGRVIRRMATVVARRRSQSRPLILSLWDDLRESRLSLLTAALFSSSSYLIVVLIQGLLCCVQGGGKEKRSNQRLTRSSSHRTALHRFILLFSLFCPFLLFNKVIPQTDYRTAIIGLGKQMVADICPQWEENKKLPSSMRSSHRVISKCIKYCRHNNNNNLRTAEAKQGHRLGHRRLLFNSGKRCETKEQAMSVQKTHTHTHTQI